MKSEDIIKIENLQNNVGFKIRWNLTYLCNYRCDFCIQGNTKAHMEKSREESIEIRKKICKNLISFIENQIDGNFQYLEIFLIGGEITILPDFIHIMENIVNCKFSGKIVIRITTNLSTKMDVLNKLLDIFSTKMNSLRELRVSASFYKEFANEEEFIEKVKLLNSKNNFFRFKKLKLVYKKIKKLFKRKKQMNNKINPLDKIENRIRNISVNIGYPLCNDQDYSDYLKFKKKYQNYVSNISFIVIREYKTSISEKLKKKIVKENKQEKKIKVTFKNGKTFYCSNNNKISLMLDKEETFNSNGYLCDIGINSISISNLGEVSRCVSCRSETIIGNMVFEDIILPTKKFRCPANRCNCSYYGVIEKIS